MITPHTLEGLWRHQFNQRQVSQHFCSVAGHNNLSWLLRGTGPGNHGLLESQHLLLPDHGQITILHRVPQHETTLMLWSLPEFPNSNQSSSVWDVEKTQSEMVVGLVCSIQKRFQSLFPQSAHLD